jgi:dephospho-CoA kinase
MQVIGITGLIGSGKSTAARYIAGTLQYSYIDVDAVGHEVLAKDVAVREAVLQEFKTADRTALASIVFNDSLALQTLCAILHPRMIEVV